MAWDRLKAEKCGGVRLENGTQPLFLGIIGSPTTIQV